MNRRSLSLGARQTRAPLIGTGLLILLAAFGLQAASNDTTSRPIVGQRVASGARITPTAAEGSVFEPLNPEVGGDPTIRANQAVTTTISPDGRTLLLLTSGYNYWTDAAGATLSFDEFVFVYDISSGRPQKTQVLRVPNSFMGLAWHPSGDEFYVSGGQNDNVHVFARQGALFEARGLPIPLGHVDGLGLDTRNDPSIGWLKVPPLAAGVAVNRSGNRLVVANLENDSISLVGLDDRRVLDEIDLRPGKLASTAAGRAGGEFPLWVVVKGDTKAYVSSLRDREIVVLDLAGDQLNVTRRIRMTGNPNRLILDRAQERLLVALDNSDTVAVIDTATDRVVRTIDVNAPFRASRGDSRYTGSHPNSLALSPDDDALFVTLGGTNAVAVVPLNEKGSSRIGLIPTGWYPNSVSVSADGRFLYVANAIAPGGPVDSSAPNQYVLQKRAGGLLTVPMPAPRALPDLTRQVLFNNGASSRSDREQKTLAFLRSKIKHVIYIVKENRTYDQVLGDLEKGNGDPSLTMFPEPISPNHHQLARQFVTLDSFYCSGAVSGDGWVWSTAGRTSDFTEKTIAVNYAGRGLSYDYEGMNRNINVSQRTVAERQAANPFVPADPDLLPGTADVAALDGPGGEKGKGYLWDAVRRAGLTVRNYGMYGDWTLNYLPEGQGYPPLLRNPRQQGVRVFFPAATGLRDVSDPYYREYDMQLPDFWRFKEWEQEFDAFVEKDRLPNLSLIELPHDHFGSFGSALDGVNTPETQMADNDYALGMIVEKVARSPFADSTLIFVVEDDAQDGPDHVDSQRSVAFVVGPYVRQGAVVSKHYSNPSMLRTIVEILGAEPMGLQVALAEPMLDLFDPTERDWTYNAIVPDVLRTTELPLPRATARNTLPKTDWTTRFSTPGHPADYWERAMQGQDFERMDALDTDRFNRALWVGVMGTDVAYPAVRHGRDLSRNRVAFLRSGHAVAAASGSSSR